MTTYINLLTLFKLKDMSDCPRFDTVGSSYVLNSLIIYECSDLMFLVRYFSDSKISAQGSGILGRHKINELCYEKIAFREHRVLRQSCHSVDESTWIIYYLDDEPMVVYQISLTS